MRQVVLYPDLEDGGWIVEVPSLPGCISQGETKEEALANVRDAIDTWIEGATEVGMSVPEETFDVQVCVVP
jgi:antitoxin HicB